MAEKFYKVRFTNGNESTAGLVVKKSQIEHMTVSDISRLFPYSESRKMKRLQQSPLMSSFDEAFYYDFDKQGVYSPKKNPAPKRKTAARTQRAAEAYVRRPSQITKKAPSKRLRTRRTKNLQTPRGVFPNPKTRRNPQSVHFDIDVNSHNARGAKAKTRVNPSARKKQIVVEYELSGQRFAIRNRGMYGWKELATFPDTPEGSENAIQYAEAYHKIAPHLRIQVVTK